MLIDRVPLTGEDDSTDSDTSSHNNSKKIEEEQGKCSIQVKSDCDHLPSGGETCHANTWTGDQPVEVYTSRVVRPSLY